MSYDFSNNLSWYISQTYFILFGFVVAAYVYIRRDTVGSIKSISRATNVVVYFLSKESASVFVTITLTCDEPFSGEITVTS